jgi:uncharacterized membrane protein YkvA (DUF1232 family)
LGPGCLEPRHLPLQFIDLLAQSVDGGPGADAQDAPDRPQDDQPQQGKAEQEQEFEHGHPLESIDNIWRIPAAPGAARLPWCRPTAPDAGAMAGRWTSWARALKRELAYYRKLLRDPRTPLVAKAVLGLAVAYLLLPFDLIPDFLPVIGALDDLVIVPLLLCLGLRLVPQALRIELRLATAGDGPAPPGGNGEDQRLDPKRVPAAVSVDCDFSTRRASPAGVGSRE